MCRPRVRSLLLLLCLPGCHTWQRRDVAQLQPAAAPTISGSHPVRVTHAGGSKLVLNRAEVVGDSVVGEVGKRSERAAVAVADVRRLEERRVSGPRTALLVAGAAVAAFALLLAAAVGGGPGMCC
jgi:hypothetical protein